MKQGLVNSQEPEEGEDLQHESAEAPAAESQEDASEEGQAEGLSPEAVRNKLEIPDDLKQAYDRIVLAGMKVMFDESTHEMALRAMQGDGPVEERLAQAIAGLMGTLVDQSNKTMPPQLVIPAGIELLAAAADFLKQSGAEPIDDQQIGEAMALFVQKILEQSGVADPAKIQAMLQGVVGDEGAPAEEAPAPRGLINNDAGA